MRRQPFKRPFAPYGGMAGGRRTWPLRGTRIVGTREMGSRIAERAVEILESCLRPTDADIANEAAANPG